MQHWVSMAIFIFRKEKVGIASSKIFDCFIYDLTTGVRFAVKIFVNQRVKFRRIGAFALVSALGFNRF
ncbi:MAG: hypothetical protein ACI83I_002489 [Bacteroidia bacterium]|jgi:hypothetical protein